MSNTTLTVAVEAIETQLLAAPSLGIVQAATMAGTAVMPATRGAVGFEVTRETTINLDAQSRNQDMARVEDVVLVTLQRRIAPKDQLTTTRADMWNKEQAVINRVTELSVNRSLGLVFLSSRDVVAGGWMKTTIKFRMRRQMQVGAG